MKIFRVHDKVMPKRIDAIIERIKTIFLPFLLISVGFILVYSFLNWLLIIKTEAISINEDLIKFWLPSTLSWIPILLWLRPRIRTMQLEEYIYSVGAYYFIAWLTIALPTIVAQHYLATATGTLAHISNVSEITSIEHTKYFTIDNLYMDKGLVVLDRTTDVSGKYNEDFNIKIFLACPIFNKHRHRKFEENIWYVLTYRDTINNRTSSAEKKSRLQVFTDHSLLDFNSKDLYSFSYLEKLEKNNDRLAFESAIRRSKNYQPDKAAIFLVPHKESYESRNGNKLGWVFGLFGGGALFFLISLLLDVNEKKKPRESINISSKAKDSNIANLFFVPKQGYYVTPIIIYLNVLIFLIMVFAGLGVFSFRTDDLLRWGATYRPYIHDLGVIRLVVSIFLHSGIPHLVNNIYGLIIAGILLEPMLGSAKYAFAYLVTGVSGSVASILYHEASVGVGASGAIFGLYGVLIVLLFSKKYKLSVKKNPLLTLPPTFVCLNLLIGVTVGGIDNAAHLGGLASGMLFGLLLHFTPQTVNRFLTNVVKGRPVKAYRRHKKIDD